MGSGSTSFQLSEEAAHRLARRAEREGLSASALLERLVIEGIGTLDHPGVVYRGPSDDRRAALQGGPDVWEVVARFRELDGDDEARIETLAEENELHPRQIRMALEFAAHHPVDVQQRMARHEEAIAARGPETEQR